MPSLEEVPEIPSLEIDEKVQEKGLKIVTPSKTINQPSSIIIIIKW